MSQNASFDASIPVLTEVLDEAAPAAPQATQVAQSGAQAVAELEAQPDARPAAELEARARELFGPRDWEALERRLAERILHQLQGRVDFVLEQRLRDSMADVLQHALTGLTSEIRGGLQQTIEKVVARAVAQELAHLQAQKK